MNGGEGIISYGAIKGRETGSALFEQNVVYDNWSVNMYFDNQPNNIARNNLIFNHPVDYNLSTTNFLWVSNTQFPYNVLGKYTVCLMLADEQNSSDGTGGYANLSGSQVYNNILAGCRIGIRDYSEGASSRQNHSLRNTVISNNTIIMPTNAFPNSTTYGIFLQDNGTRNTGTVIQNNIIYGYNNDWLIYSERLGALSGITLNNNVYFSPGATPFGGFNGRQDVFYNFAGWKANAVGSDTNSKFLDPQLVGVSSFSAGGTGVYPYASADLGPSSPARGAGVPQTFPAQNFALQPRGTWNAGAY
jgi:hypothetical protein